MNQYNPIMVFLLIIQHFSSSHMIHSDLLSSSSLHQSIDPMVLSSGNGKPNFVDPISNVSIATGRNTMLICTVNNLGNYKVAWLKVDTDSESTLLTIHTQTLVHDSRFRVSHNNHRQWYLHISNVQVTDKGFYMCQINTEPMITQIGYLDVLVPPIVVESETSSDTIVDERHKLSLRCRAEGYPPPVVTWRREDNKELNLGLYGGKKYSASKIEGEFLNITQVTRDDMGAYLCIASNGVPPSVSKRIIVQVNFRPKIKVQNQLVGASVSSDVHLECRCEASPTPTTSWIRHDGSILLNTYKYVIREEHDSYRTKMKLKISDLEEKDFGSYKCVAKNQLGEKEGLIRLYEIPPPTMPIQLHPIIVHSDDGSSRSSSNSNLRNAPDNRSHPHPHSSSGASTRSLMDHHSATNQKDGPSKRRNGSDGQNNGEMSDEAKGGVNQYGVQSFASIIIVLLLIIINHLLIT